MESALELATSQRMSSQEELHQVLREEQELNAALLKTSQELSQALLAPTSDDAQPEPEPESVSSHSMLGALQREHSHMFSPKRLAWSLEAFGNVAVGDGEQLQLTSSQALSYGSIFENQRRRLGVFKSREYNALNLTVGDQAAWTDEAGEPRLRAPLPPGMAWSVNADSNDTDADGWAYAFKFGDQWYSQERGRKTWVRRREWVVVPLVPEDAAVPAGWVERLGSEVHLADSPEDATTLIVEVRAARRVRTAGNSCDGTMIGAGSEALVPIDTRLCARVTWHGHSFQTEPSVHPGPNPVWFSADNALNCRHCLPLTDAAIFRNVRWQTSAGIIVSEFKSPVASVHVWTEQWVDRKIDRIEFLYADGSTNKYGTPSGDQGSAGTIEEHCLELNSVLQEYLVAVRTLSERRLTGSGSKTAVAGLTFVTSLGRSWTVGLQTPPPMAEARPGVQTRTYETRCMGIQANGQCITGLHVSQTYSGLLSSVDTIVASNIFQPVHEAAVELARAQTGQASPWRISIPPAWCSNPRNRPEDQLCIELISPGQSTTFGSSPERSYGMVHIPVANLQGAVGCDGWYILGNTAGSVPGDEYVALGEVRIAWSFVATSVPSDLQLSAVPSPSTLFRCHTESTRAASSYSAVDGLGFKIQEHALQSWMLGVSHGLCVEEAARRAWSSFDFGAATPQSTWRMVETYGVPAPFRIRVWPFIAGTDKLKICADLLHAGNGTVYQALCQRYEVICDDEDPKAQIRKDLRRTFPGEATQINSEHGVAALERIIGAYAVYNPRVGYCQSMNLIGGHLLLALGWQDRPGDREDVLSSEIEETAFWLLRHLAEEIVPHYWAEPSMPGMMHHTDVLDEVCKALIPQTMTHFTDIPMALVGMKWMAPLFGHTLPAATLYALWDRLLCQEGGGADILLCAALTVLRGIDADVLRHAPHDALQLSAGSIYDTAPFINTVGSFHQRINQYDGCLPRAPHAVSHHFSDEVHSNPRCSQAWKDMQCQAMRSAWCFTEHQMMRLADAFLSAAIGSTSGVEASLSISECEAVVVCLLPGLGLVMPRESFGSGSGGSQQSHTTLAGLLCCALSKCEPHVHIPEVTHPPSSVSLAQFGHGMHALYADETTLPQRAALW